ncbi:hypothetical protein, partial [Escherichia coli]
RVWEIKLIGGDFPYAPSFFPRTGLALASVPIRYLDNGKSELHYQYVQYREKHPKSEHWRTCVLFVDIP